MQELFNSRVLTIGDVVMIVSLPKYWGSDDVRGKVGTICEMSYVKGYCTVLVDGRKRTVRVDGLKAVTQPPTDSLQREP